MKLLSSFKTFLLSRLGRVAGFLQASRAEWAPRPAPALVPIPIRADRHAHRTAERRHHRGA